jgi:hypothetical protein
VQQVAWSSRESEDLGPANDNAELEALKAAAQRRMTAGQPDGGARQ